MNPFGGFESHGFGGGSSFFGTHFGGRAHAQASASHSGENSRCRTVTQKIGNMMTTYTQCS